MDNKYYYKVAKFKDHISITHYEYGVKFHQRGRAGSQGKLGVFAKRKPSERALKYSNYRAKQNVMNLINANMPQFNSFITLTYSYPNNDINLAFAHLKAFIRKLNKVLPVVKYIAVHELQKDVDFQGKLKPFGGSLHFHILANFYYPHKRLLSMWGQGAVFIKKIQKFAKINNMGAYLSKYLTKDKQDLKYFNQKRFSYSRNLDKPDIVKSTVCPGGAELLREFLPPECLTFDRYSFSRYYGLIRYQTLSDKDILKKYL